MQHKNRTEKRTTSVLRVHIWFRLLERFFRFLFFPEIRFVRREITSRRPVNFARDLNAYLCARFASFVLHAILIFRPFRVGDPRRFSTRLIRSARYYWISRLFPSFLSEHRIDRFRRWIRFRNRAIPLHTFVTTLCSSEFVVLRVRNVNLTPALHWFVFALPVPSTDCV